MQAVERHLRHRLEHSHVSVGEGPGGGEGRGGEGGARGWYASWAYGGGGGRHSRSLSPVRTRGGEGGGLYNPIESVPLRTFLMINNGLREEYERHGFLKSPRYSGFT